MAKLALLIGVSEYEPGLNPLPNAVKDVAAVQQVLESQELGGFDQVKTLTNPDRAVMEGEVESLFSDRSKDDLVLLFFSGHGVKDDNGRLFFATRNTRKSRKGELVRSTAVSSSFVLDVMNNSRSKRQVVILDCCFSGAFAEDMTAKDDGSVDVRAQLGAEGRAVLTSSTSTQYSFEQQGIDLSVYTQFLVEGIETGAADLDNDGSVSVDELHDYAKQRVQEMAPAMKPEIYAAREGFRIRLASAPISDVKLKYRREVDRVMNEGRIFLADRRLLNQLQLQLGLSVTDAFAIEAEVQQAYWQYQENLEQYRQALIEAVEHENPLSDPTRRKFRQLQERWKLKPEHVATIEAQVAQQVRFANPIPEPPIQLPVQPPVQPPIAAATEPKSVMASGGQTVRIELPKRRFPWRVLVALVLLAGGAGYWAIANKSETGTLAPSPPVSTPMPTATPSPPSTPTPTPTPTPAPSLNPDSCIEVTYPGGLNIRSEPDGNSAKINGASFGEKLYKTGAAQNSWIEIVKMDNVRGWVAEQHTKPCGSGNSANEPSPPPPEPPTPTPPDPAPAPLDNSSYPVRIIYRPQQEAKMASIREALRSAGYPVTSVASDLTETKNPQPPGTTQLVFTNQGRNRLDNVTTLIRSLIQNDPLIQDSEARPSFRRGEVIQIQLY